MAAGVLPARHETFQRPVDELREDCWDVVVAGAGPAGATAALHLARDGYRVLLLDREAFPRDKVCGDAVFGDALRALDRAGVLHEVRDAGYQGRTLAVFSPSRIEVDLDVECLTLPRRKLDALIARKAVELGAVFCHGRVEAVESQVDGTIACRIVDHEKVLRGRVGIVATGSNVALLDRVGGLERRRPSALAARCYVRSSLPLDRLVASYDRSIIPGYAWIFPLGNGEFNLGCGVFLRKPDAEHPNLRQMLDRFVAEFPLARDLLRHGEYLSPLRGAMLRCSLRGARALARGNVLAIGESLGATFPFTGEGIGKAMETGEIAAQVIRKALNANDDRLLQEFPARVERELRFRYYGYEVAESWLSIAWLSDLIARRALKSRTLRQNLSGILNETVDPRDVFSLRGLARAWWG